MTDYRYLVIDASPGGVGTGGVLAEIPLTGVRFDSLLSASGSLSGSMPLTHPKATETLLKPGARDLAVVRDGLVVWSGTIHDVDASYGSNDSLTVTAREAQWIFSRRTIETDKSYASQDLFAIVRDLITSATGKTNGALYRFDVTATNSGLTKSWDFAGYGRRNVGEIIDDLAADSFDYRLSITTPGSESAFRRLFELGSPTLGLTRGLVLEPPGLVGLSLQQSLGQAANRVHCRGANSLVHTSTNAASYAALDLLLEEVVDRTDVVPSAVIVSIAQDHARRLKPPRPVLNASYTPGLQLPYGWALPGDTVPLKLSHGYLQVDASRRVIGVETFPGDGDKAERVVLMLNDPAA